VEYPQGIDSRCKEAFDALHCVFTAWGYVLRSPGCWGYLCRKITGGSGYSLHAYAITLDVNAPANPYGPRLVTDMPRAMVEAGLAIRTKGGHEVFGWGGNYRNNKDAMHWEVVVSPAELALGIDWSTVAGANQEEDWMTSKDAEALLLGINHEVKVGIPKRIESVEEALVDFAQRIGELEREWDAPAGGNKGESARSEIDKLRRDMRQGVTKLGFQAES
jgi:hypothetical protein